MIVVSFGFVSLAILGDEDGLVWGSVSNKGNPIEIDTWLEKLNIIFNLYKADILT